MRRNASIARKDFWQPMALLLGAAALCSLLGSASVSRLPLSGACFGGASHGAADNTARYC